MPKNLSPRERIAKARINLLTDYPFFGNLAMKLIPRELTPEEVAQYQVPAMGVDVYGNLVYNPEWVAKQTDTTLKCAVAHEVMHVVLKHLERLGTRDKQLWNIATDAVINHILSHTFNIPSNWVQLKEAKGKSAEELYDILLKNAKFYKGEGGFTSWDTHFFGGDTEEKGGEPKAGGQLDASGGKEGKGESPFYQPGQQKFDATRAVREAYNFAKTQGKVPAGIERMFADILNPQLDWRDILRKFIVDVIPHDFSYTRPHKKSFSVGYYMPMIKKESIEIVIAVDTSGSISEREYAEFLSEIYAMVKQFESLRATLILCDAEVQDVYEIDETFDPFSIKGHGYGGTDARPVYKYIMENMNWSNVKLLVYFSDGYITIPEEEYPFPTLWVITSQGRTDEVEKMKNAIVVQMPRNHVGEDDD